jgi:hypothetical protein
MRMRAAALALGTLHGLFACAESSSTGHRRGDPSGAADSGTSVAEDSGASPDPETGCCIEHHENYQNTGTAPVPTTSCPAIVLAIEEGQSSTCKGGCSISSIIPGQEMFETAVVAGESFSVTTPVTYVNTETPPILDAQAYCDANQNGEVDTGETCFAFTQALFANHAEIVFTVGTCPGRL